MVTENQNSPAILGIIALVYIAFNGVEFVQERIEKGKIEDCYLEAEKKYNSADTLIKDSLISSANTSCRDNNDRY